MGYSLREYEREVPPANRAFHETAELFALSREGVLPIDPDDADHPGSDGIGGSRGTPGSKRIR